MPSKPYRVLVCGGRDYKDYKHAEAVLNHIDGTLSAERTLVIVEGGAKGADELAHMWATSHSKQVQTYTAQWDLYGKKAGPIRNQEMLDSGVDLVVAFPGWLHSKGTEDMVRRAHEAHVRIVRA